MSDSAYEGWICHQSGRLNPHLDPTDVGPSAFFAGRQPLATMGASLINLMTPSVLNTSRNPPTLGVVLASAPASPSEARSFNMGLEGDYSSSTNESMQLLYVRIPELHLHVSDPFCEDLGFGPKQIEALIHEHMETMIPNWAPSSTLLVPGSIVEVDIIEVRNGAPKRGVVKRVISEATSLPSKKVASAQQAFNESSSSDDYSGYLGDPKFPPAARTAWEQLQALGTDTITKAADGICVKGPTFASGQWPLLPVSGKLGQLDTKREPTSIDIGCAVGTPIYAAADGVIASTLDSDDLCGGTIKVRYTNPKKTHSYCHCSEIPDVPKNHPIKRGDVIGLTGGEPGSPGAGNTFEPHLHITTRMNSKDFAEAFGWDFSSKNAGKMIVGKSSCEGSS